MKKMISLILTGVLAFSLMACGKTEAPENQTMPDDMANMTAPVDALARCMLENKLEYDSQDPDFFWIALYYFTGAYGLEYADENSYQLQIPTAAMEEYASTLFADYDALLDLPSIMKGNVSYNPDADTYAVSRGDIGLSEMKFSSYEKTEEGHRLTAALWSTGPDQTLISTYDVTLVENVYTDGIADPMYNYSIAGIIPVSEEDMVKPGANVATALFNGLTDSHTVELTMSDGSVQPFQFEGDSDVAAALSTMQEGDGLTIAYIEVGGGSMMIISIE